MNINMLEVAKAGAPIIGTIALAVAESTVLLAVCLGGALVFAGVWAAQGFPRSGASA